MERQQDPTEQKIYKSQLTYNTMDTEKYKHIESLIKRTYSDSGFNDCLRRLMNLLVKLYKDSRRERTREINRKSQAKKYGLTQKKNKEGSQLTQKKPQLTDKENKQKPQLTHTVKNDSSQLTHNKNEVEIY